ncbi:helix-turn-helix domain-containing protein [Rhodovulum visakhapatnamense]|uniref:helix-turn-helix domain-containing protein n=1 Tax=Rhodovulum visakhapatnamense TaxID=364297 RepID=UPI001921BBD4|nr:helix-turn-helix domain-containing protein [Rhodovulum visakhapatnamense]
MDEKWFKQQQRRAGITAEEIASEMGRHRSVVSRILGGKQRMTMDWAKAFARALGVSLDEVLLHAGEIEEGQAGSIRSTLTDGDVCQWKGSTSEEMQARAVLRALGQDRPAVEIWRVKGGAMALDGFLPGDLIAVDRDLSERVRLGDTVIARSSDWNTGNAQIVLRRFEPPVLVASGGDSTGRRVLVVDGNNVVVLGKVTACWRV